MAPKFRTFPRVEIERFLITWWDKQTSTALSRPKPPEESRKTGGTVFDIQPELSSQKAVPVLLELADILGFEPDKNVVKKGGYRGRNEFVLELTARVEQAYQERQSSPDVAVPQEGGKNNAELRARQSPSR